MSDIERIRNYVDKTNSQMKNRSAYDMRIGEIMALYDARESGWYNVLCLAFNFGMAKGYRMAKKEAQV